MTGLIAMQGSTERAEERAREAAPQTERLVALLSEPASRRELVRAIARVLRDREQRERRLRGLRSINEGPKP